MPNANRDKGNKFERDIAKYFQAHGVLTAKRLVVTGWRTASDNDPDLGDLKGIAGICVQAKNVVKSHPRGLAGKALADIMAETQAQCDAAGLALPLLVEKRLGHSDVGFAWAHLPANFYLALMLGVDPHSYPTRDHTHPVRIELHTIISRLAEFSAMCSEEAA